MNQRAASGLAISLPTLRPKLPRWLPFLAVAIAIAASLALLASTTHRSAANRATTASASAVNGPGSDASASASDAVANAIPVVSDGNGHTLPTAVGGLLNLPAVERIKPGPANGPSGTPGPLPSGSAPPPAPTDCPSWNLIGPWFDPDQAIPHSAAWALLADIAAELRQTNLPIQIIGHTDIRTPAFPGGNQGLSEARAQAVLDQIATFGISADRMTASGRGASELLNTGTSEFAHQQNRRVVVTLVCKG
jgi:outer membrane protein OmpA-like peptidoglycan-associated protein